MKNILSLLLTLLCSLTSVQAETLWGYTTGTEFKGTGYGYAAEYGVGMLVPGSETLVGQRIVAVNIPAKSSHMTALRLWAGDRLGSTSLLSQDCTGMALPAGYVRIDLQQPITIPEGGLYIGYFFTIEELLDIYDQNPVGIVRTDGNPIPSSLYVSLSVYGGGWDDLSAERASAMQLFLEGTVTHDDYISPASILPVKGVAGQTTQAQVSVAGLNAQPIQSVGYSISLGGQTTQHTCTLSTPLEPATNQQSLITLPLDVPATAGHYEGQLTLTHINGQPNATQEQSVSFGIDALTRQAKRMSVVEDVTGTGCGWCPSGWVIMERIRQEMSDRALGISVHSFNNYSPLYQPNYDQQALPTSRAPLCMVDRKTELFDPYYGGNDHLNAPAVVDRLCTDLPEAELSVSARFTDAELNTIEATATADMLTDLEGAYLAYVLTGDGLTGSEPQWQQDNSYASFTADQYPADLAPFCYEGQYGHTSVQLVYNDVMLDSSWQHDDQRHSPALPEQCTAGQQVTTTYTLHVPTGRLINSHVKRDQLHVTALLIKGDGTIANARRCPVEGIPEGLEQVMMDNGQQSMFDLQGRSYVRQPQRGIVLQGGKKYVR